MILKEKVLWLDVETTGLDPEKNGVVQIAGILELQAPYSTYSKCVEFSFQVRPFEGDEVADEALSVNGFSREEIKSFPEPHVVYMELIALLGEHLNSQEKFTLAGQRVNFDDGFMSSWFQKLGKQFLLPKNWNEFVDFRRRLDLRDLTNFLQVTGKETFLNTKLTTVSKKLGVSLEHAHDALSDIRATRECFGILADRLSYQAPE